MVALARVAGGMLVGLLCWTVVLDADAAQGDRRGWGWLIERLVADGVPSAHVEAVFLDPRVEPFDGLRFSLRPRESAALYRAHLTRDSVARARRCRETHRQTLDAAAAEHGVPAEVLAALVHVESACGRNTGARPIVPALGRLAMAASPATLLENIAWHTAGLAGPERVEVEARTRARAARLDEMFYPEVVAAFEVARRLGVHPLALRGSSAGAFGMPQFLPRSYLRYGTDGDGDGVIDLDEPADAIHSAARYLAAHGWRPGISRAAQRDVVWAYNRSEAYIDAVLGLADRLAGGALPTEQPVTRSERGRSRPRTVAARRLPPVSSPRTVSRKSTKRQAPGRGARAAGG
jgi:membrane-bound lytic murein transglycosylase B